MKNEGFVGVCSTQLKLSRHCICCGGECDTCESLASDAFYHVFATSCFWFAFALLCFSFALFGYHLAERLAVM